MVMAMEDRPPILPMPRKRVRSSRRLRRRRKVVRATLWVLFIAAWSVAIFFASQKLWKRQTEGKKYYQIDTRVGGSIGGEEK